MSKKNMKLVNRRYAEMRGELSMDSVLIALLNRNIDSFFFPVHQSLEMKHPMTINTD